MAALDEYRHKRNPAATTEPMPLANEPTEPRGNTFVIQEHHASALHWDFRLERDGVLVSWAVPKGVPTDPKVNRLAVHVEDHPLEYGKYEGTIGDGQYGAGPVTIWDAGTYVTEKWTDREVKIVLTGRRVQGRFVLFQTGGKQWMMHRMDGPPRPDWLTLPDRIEPMRAVEGSLPRGRGWNFEMAWSGDRALARIEGGRVALGSGGAGNADELGARLPELRALGESVGATQLLLDGVVSRFSDRVVYLVFDLLHLDGRSLVAEPYRERRKVLEELQLSGPAWLVPPVFEGSGTEARKTSRAQHLPGVIAKRARSVYQAGERSDDWIFVSS
jgi:DNA ligase D-like protein (predicted 3'-phosphoesterase)